ncbi:MAG: hypothetical protein AB1705_21255 [Verrucomicrobiota bacterium]
MKFDFERLRSLLRKPADAPDVRDLIEREPSQIERTAYLGYVAFQEHGVSVMFVEASRAIPKKEIADPKALYLSAFHLHRHSHEGHSQYLGKLPGGVAFDDSATEVISKLGQPIATGGGGMSTVLKKPIPRWMRYPIGEAFFQFQLDASMRVEMVTLYVPDQPDG